jgi:hypothetical protein
MYKPPQQSEFNTRFDELQNTLYVFSAQTGYDGGITAVMAYNSEQFLLKYH